MRVTMPSWVIRTECVVSHDLPDSDESDGDQYPNCHDCHHHSPLVRFVVKGPFEVFEPFVRSVRIAQKRNTYGCLWCFRVVWIVETPTVTCVENAPVCVEVDYVRHDVTHCPIRADRWESPDTRH